MVIFADFVAASEHVFIFQMLVNISGKGVSIWCSENLGQLLVIPSQPGG